MTIRNLVRREEELAHELIDLEKWLRAKKAKELDTKLAIVWKYTEEYGGMGQPTNKRDAELYRTVVGNEELTKMAEDMMERKITAKQSELKSIRRQLLDLDNKLGVITK